MKCFYIYFVMVSVITATTPEVDICESCVQTSKCAYFRNMDRRQQQLWMERFPCNMPKSHDFGSTFGFSATAKGDYVCCSNKIWGVENLETVETSSNHESSSKLVRVTNSEYQNNNNNGIPSTNYEEDTKISYHDSNDPSKSYDIEKFSSSNGNQWYPDGQHSFYNSNYWIDQRNQKGSVENDTTSSADTNKSTNNRNYWNERPGRNQWSYESQHFNNDRNKDSRLRKRERNNNESYQRTPLEGNRPRQLDNYFNNQGTDTRRNNFNYNKPDGTPYARYPNSGNNGQGNSRSSGQCDRLTSFPPEPKSGCCGREAADDDRIIGGRATELYEYPWTVLLLTTFDYGTQLAGFNCGGSLISARYILSAGHCVHDKNGVVRSVQVSLAEYDKRSFPRDCKISRNGRECIDNKVLYAENVIVHPQYDADGLQNDISLIRLPENVPYTDYMRPICLPTINVDEPEFSNLQFEVAGWGLNGQYQSDVKQSTVVHLVPQNECRRFYPQLTTWHLCAAGHRGEDTCKGDSGGPLMTLYRGRYYATGVVSGKRADTPCGTAVPSLYTNVYHYLDWIRNNIGN